jgi:hypothetical protein
MGRRSLEVYLTAEILQEFLMYPGKRAGGGIWEMIINQIINIGLTRRWSCFLVSLLWAGVFAGFGVILDFMGWRMKL